MRHIRFLRAEARWVGIVGLAAPLLAAALISAAGLVSLWAGQASADRVGAAVVRVSGIVFPLAVGFAGIGLATRDRLVELQLSTPTPYAHTVLRRVAILLAGCVVLEWASIGILSAAGAWNHPAPFLLTPLVPVGPGVLLAGVGVIGGLVLRSGGAAALLVLIAWLMQLQATGGSEHSWLGGRLTLVAAGAVFTVVGLSVVCGSTERLVGRAVE